MSNVPTPPLPGNPPAPATPAAAPDVNMPLTDIRNQPRNADGTFASAVPPEPPAAPVAPAEPTPENPVITTDLGNGQVEVKYLTGEVFKGTVAEVAAKIGQSHVSTKTWAQSEVAKAKQPVVPPPPEPPSLFSDPQEAAVAEYTLNLIAKGLGYPDGQTMQRALGHIQDSTVDYSSQLTALQFQAKAPDFNPSPENNDKLFRTITESGITDEYFGALPREQQVKLMQQAHAFCLATNQYQAKPAANPNTPRIPQPPPPAPTTGVRQPDTGGQIPPELQAQPGDSLEVIKQKWEKAAALGLVAPRGA